MNDEITSSQLTIIVGAGSSRLRALSWKFVDHELPELCNDCRLFREFEEGAELETEPFAQTRALEVTESVAACKMSVSLVCRSCRERL